MKTIKSIQWRAKRDALIETLVSIKCNIKDEIEILTFWIENEEKKAKPERGGLPDDVE